MIAPMILAALVASDPGGAAVDPARAPEAAAAPAPEAVRAVLLEGKFPDAPGKSVMLGKCGICHSVDYVSNNRLTPAQWKGTVAKMRRFGAPMTDDEAAVLTEYLGRYWTTDLPEPRAKPVPPPRGALPSR